MVITEQLFEVSLFLKDGSKYQKLEHVQMNTIPLVGHYFMQFNTKKIYSVDAVIHDDMNVYLMLSEISERNPYFGFDPKVFGIEG